MVLEEDYKISLKDSRCPLSINIPYIMSKYVEIYNQHGLYPRYPKKMLLERYNRTKNPNRHYFFSSLPSNDELQMLEKIYYDHLASELQNILEISEVATAGIYEPRILDLVRAFL